MASAAEEVRSEDTKAGADDSAAPRKRRRRSGWDAPASATASVPSGNTGPAATSVVATAPVSAAAVPVVSPAVTVDAAAAQKLAFQKAQEILASSGLNVAVGSVINPSLLSNPNVAAIAAKNFDCRIYVGSLNYSVTEVEIRAIFGSIGPIRAIDMSFDPLLQRSKGYCFVDFENPVHAQAALGLNGVEIAGRPMKVGRPQGGPNGMSMAQIQAVSMVAAAVTPSLPALAPVSVAPLQPAVQAASSSLSDNSNKRTVILYDMVPLEEASDPGLKDEIEEEAATHGPLKDISIAVINNEFVKVTLIYYEPSSALKAFKAMNGRYFGGKVIKASME